MSTEHKTCSTHMGVFHFVSAVHPSADYMNNVVTG